MDTTVLTALIVWYAVFLFSTSLHEAAHALAAARGGDYTALAAGQATLNPLPHIRRERVGMVLVPLASFFFSLYAHHLPWMIGWASAPFNPYWAARHPGRAFAMSLAGPLSHLIPAAAAWTAMLAGLKAHLFLPGYYGHSVMPVVPAAEGQPVMAAACMILGVLFQLNLILCVFNLLPIPPMDGSEIWFLFVAKEEDRLRWRSHFASYSLAGTMFAWYVFPRIFVPVYVQARGLLYHFGFE